MYQILSNILYDKIFKNVFISVLISFFCCHSMGVFNKYSFFDDAVALFEVGSTIQSGRWGLELLKRFNLFFFGDTVTYSLPVLGGCYTIFFLTLSLYLIMKLIKIKDPFFISLLSILFVSSPFFVLLFSFMFTAAYYIFSFFLSVLSAYLICSSNKRYIKVLGVLLVVFSMSIYQAFFSITVTLILIHFIDECKKDFEWKSFIIHGIHCLIMGILILLIYYFSVKFSTYFTDIPLADYKNINKIGKEDLFVYLIGMKKAYSTFFLGSRKFFPLNTIYLYYTTLVFLVVLVLLNLKFVFVQGKSAVILLLLLLPFCLNFIYIVSPTEPTMLMLLTQMLIFVFFVSLVKNVNISLIRYFKTMSYILFFLIGFMFCRYSNIVYLNYTFAQERAINYLSVMVSKIKNMPGYRDDYPVVYLNKPGEHDKTIHWQSFHSSIPFRHLIKEYSWNWFIGNWLMFYPKTGRLEKFENNPEVQDMPYYPNDGSIKIINGVIVVKF